MSLDTPQLNARKPTGVVPYPFVLLEGEEGSGKSWAAAKLSASDRVGRTFWLDLDEGSADEYGAIDGVRFEVLEHDGTYAQVLEQILAAREVARAAHAAGEPPTVLVIDTMFTVWEGLKDWVNSRAKAKPSNQRKLAADPAAELDVSRNLWNDAGNRYRRLTNVLKTFPGVVVGITRGKWVSDTDPDTGQPYRDGRKTYRIEGEKNLGYDATVVLRMLRGQPVQITKARSVHAGVRPTEPPVVLDGPREPKGELLDWLVFDVLKAGGGGPRDLVRFTAGDLLPEERADEDAIAAADAAETERAKRGRSNDDRQGQARPPAPNAQPAPSAADLAQLTADRLTAQVWPTATLEQVSERTTDEQAASTVTYRGKSMTLAEALADAYRLADEATGDAQNPPEEPPASPSGTTDPPAEAPQPENGTGTTLTADAHEVAVEALTSGDAEYVRGLYRGSADLLAVDVTGAVTGADLETLGLDPELVTMGNVPLGGLLHKVGAYVDRHKVAVRSDPAGEADVPFDPWADGSASG